MKEVFLGSIPAGVHETVWQMFKDGPVWDGNLVCKQSRNWLVEHGYAFKAHGGYNSLTETGVELAVSLGMGVKKDKVPQ